MIHPALQNHLRERFGLVCSACALPSLLVGAAAGWLYPHYREREEAFANFLPMLRKLFGGDSLDLFSSMGFLSLPFQHPLTLLSMGLGVAFPGLVTIAGDRGRKSLDLILATRLTRGALMANLFLFMGPFALLLGLSPLLGTALGAWISDTADTLDFSRYAMASGNAVLLGVWWGSFALLVSAIASDGTMAAIWYGASFLITFVIQAVAMVWEAGDFLFWVTPFGYYHPARVIGGVADPWRDSLILFTTSLCLAAAAWTVQVRRRQA